jgi:hypothetical protein
MNPEEQLQKLLDDKDAVVMAVDTLFDCLNATRSFQQNGEKVTVPDHATRQKAASLLLAHGIGLPIERAQILTGTIPTKPMERAKFRALIERKLAALVNRPDVTVDELLAAREALVDPEGKERMSPMTEEQAIAEARRIHGLPPAGQEPQS